MKEEGILKILFLLVLGINIEFFINSFLINFYIILPFTFLIFSYFVYKSHAQFSSSSAFFIGLFVDFVSGTYIGLNPLVFLITTYIINSYKYVFRLFSYLQISIFFGIISTLYLGLTHLFININNYSYLTLLMSFFTNTSLCFIISIFRIYKPIFSRRRKI